MCIAVCIRRQHISEWVRTVNWFANLDDQGYAYCEINLKLTILPATPPAIKAKPTNSIALALHTARLSPLPKPSSPLTLSLSIKDDINIPMSVHMPGIQSRKVTWTGGGVVCGSSYGGWACADSIAASKNAQLATANYRKKRLWLYLRVTKGTKRTRIPARYIPAVRRYLPISRRGNGLKQTRLGS